MCSIIFRVLTLLSSFIFIIFTGLCFRYYFKKKFNPKKKNYFIFKINNSIFNIFVLHQLTNSTQLRLT